jgi:hemoglobin
MLRDATREPRARPTEADIRRIVETFYARVREDPELGPIFEGRIGSNWDAHLDRMVDFWSSVLLATARYRGNPLEKHASIPDLESRHYDRWLTHFDAVLSEVVDEHLARDIGARARRMRVVLDRSS